MGERLKASRLHSVRPTWEHTFPCTGRRAWTRFVTATRGRACRAAPRASRARALRARRAYRGGHGPLDRPRRRVRPPRGMGIVARSALERRVDRLALLVLTEGGQRARQGRPRTPRASPDSRRLLPQRAFLFQGAPPDPGGDR